MRDRPALSQQRVQGQRKTGANLRELELLKRTHQVSFKFNIVPDVELFINLVPYFQTIKPFFFSILCYNNKISILFIFNNFEKN